MTEELKIRIIYILVLIASVIVYFCISGALAKSFNKKPGTYLIGQAEVNGSIIDFQLYSMEKFEA